MANVNKPFGFRPIGHLNGNPWNGQTKKFLIEDDYATALYIGQAIVVTATGPIDDPTGWYPAINAATAGDDQPILGVIVSFDPIDATGVEHSTPYSPASSGRYANCVVDPDVIFIIQDDGAAVLAGDACTENANFTSTGGTTTTGLSTSVLDAAGVSAGGDASNQLLVLGVWPSEDNALGIYCIWEVLISRHAFRSVTGILGV